MISLKFDVLFLGFAILNPSFWTFIFWLYFYIQQSFKSLNIITQQYMSHFSFKKVIS